MCPECGQATSLEGLERSRRAGHRACWLWVTWIVVGGGALFWLGHGLAEGRLSNHVRDIWSADVALRLSEIAFWSGPLVWSAGVFAGGSRCARRYRQGGAEIASAIMHMFTMPGGGLLGLAWLGYSTLYVMMRSLPPP